MDPADLQLLARRARAARIALAREDINAFVPFIMRDERTGASLRQAPMHVEWQALADRHPRLVVWSHVEAGKCTDPGIPVIHYDGRVTRTDEVRVGDQLLGPDGTPRRVLSTTKGRGPMYRIVPKKGEPWACNGPHVLTLVHTTTDEVIDIPVEEYLTKSAFWKSNYKLFQPGPIEFAHNDDPRPVDPYFLGVWLGDGTKSLNSVQVTKPDAEIEAACRAEAARFGLRVVVTRSGGGCPEYTLSSARPGVPNALRRHLREMMAGGLCIPSAYLRGPLAVRAAVLAGLLDTDGYLSKRCYEIVQKSERLADDIMFLARSLGLRATKRYKVVNGTRYTRLRLMGDTASIPTRIGRKTASARVGGKDSRRVGFTVESIGEGDYAGFTLDGDHHYLLGDFTVTHNTVQLVVGRVLHALGRDPTVRCAIVGNTAMQAVKLVRSIANHIQNNHALHEVFPDLKPATPWTHNSITIQRNTNSRDPSVQALGIHGNVLGARLDLLIMDDVVDFENARTAHGRNDVKDWVFSTLFGRLTADARVVVLGNAYHPDDLLHALEKLPGWVARRYPVLNPQGQPTWPERWPMRRIEAKRLEVGAQEFARSMLCQARSDDDARFKRGAIDKCKERGKGRGLVPSRLEWTTGTDEERAQCRIYTGVDLAVQTHSAADRTALTTIAVWPNGDRELLWLESGRWTAVEIVTRIVNTHKRYGSLVIMENVAAQDFLLQITRHVSDVPVRPFTTGRGKASLDFQAEAMAAEMEGGKWIIPCDENLRAAPEVEEWISELLFYDPRAHTGDRMASSLFARHAASQGKQSTGHPIAQLVGNTYRGPRVWG